MNFLLQQVHSRPENLKKVQAKKFVKSNGSKIFFREIAFSADLNFFPVPKLIFGHFWSYKKWIFVKNFFREIDSIDFTSFFWPGLFLNFLAYYTVMYVLDIKLTEYFNLNSPRMRILLWIECSARVKPFVMYFVGIFNH